MDFQTVINKLEMLRSRTGFSASDKTEIEIIYREVFSKDFIKTSCSDCYRDAVIEIYTYLKRNGIMKVRCNYSLKNGVLLQEFGSPDMYTNATLTDEAAEIYLSRNPGGIKFFATLPDNWEERVKNRTAPKSKMNEDLISALVNGFKDGKTAEALKEEYKAFLIDGKNIPSKSLSAHIKAALASYEASKKEKEDNKE